VDTTSPKESIRAQRDFEDDPAGWEAHLDTTLWYMIAEVDFGRNAFDHLKFPLTLPNGETKNKPQHWGTEIIHGQPCTRATLQKARILVFHVDHAAANTKCHKTRQRLRQMALDIAKFQVDFAGGDANGSLIKYYNADSAGSQLSIKHSSLMMTIQAMVDAVNKVCGTLHDNRVPLAYQAVTATTWEHLQSIGLYFQHTPEEREKLEYPEQDVICLMAFSWAHTKWADDSRKMCARHIESKDQDVHAGEYLISVNELAMSLQNHNLWLNSSDADWHRPLQVVIRTWSQKNFKFQGQMTEKQKRNQERFAPAKKTTSTTGYDKGEGWTDYAPWNTREDKVWKNYDKTARKQQGWEWEPTPSQSASSSSATGSAPWRPSLQNEKPPWQKDDKEGEESENLTWRTRHGRY